MSIERQGRYELLAPIAAGGMASVWAARLRGPAGFAKVVALKTILPELASEPDYRTMFLDEARVASKLRHPNVCGTFDLGEEDGTLFMAMEWVDGPSLHRLLRPARTAIPLPFALAAAIVAQAAAGLHAAHEATDDDGTALAVVHRDVSPQNVLVSVDGHVKVTDFGVAKSIGKRHATLAGQAKGKLAYMAPEQLRSGDDVDRRADVFALGALLYELTTGEKPFVGETDGDVMKAILLRAPATPRALVPGYPAELERIVARAMAKEVEQRFASAEGLRLALERWLASVGGAPAAREIAALVHDRCGAELDERRERIRAASARVTLVTVDPPARTGIEASAPRRPRSRLPRLLGMAVVAGCALAGGAVVRHGVTGGATSSAALRGTAPGLPPAIAPTAPAAPSTTGPSTPEPAAAPPTAEVGGVVAFVVDAPGAQLVVDGAPLADGAMRVARPAAGDVRIVLVHADAHEDRIVLVDATTPGMVEVSLDRLEASAPDTGAVDGANAPKENGSAAEPSTTEDGRLSLR